MSAGTWMDWSIEGDRRGLWRYSDWAWDRVARSHGCEQKRALDFWDGSETLLISTSASRALLFSFFVYNSLLRDGEGQGTTANKIIIKRHAKLFEHLLE